MAPPKATRLAYARLVPVPLPADYLSSLPPRDGVCYSCALIKALTI